MLQGYTSYIQDNIGYSGGKEVVIKDMDGCTVLHGDNSHAAYKAMTKQYDTSTEDVT